MPRIAKAFDDSGDGGLLVDTDNFYVASGYYYKILLPDGSELGVNPNGNSLSPPFTALEAGPVDSGVPFFITEDSFPSGAIRNIYTDLEGWAMTGMRDGRLCFCPTTKMPGPRWDNFWIFAQRRNGRQYISIAQGPETPNTKTRIWAAGTDTHPKYDPIYTSDGDQCSFEVQFQFVSEQ